MMLAALTTPIIPTRVSVSRGTRGASRARVFTLVATTDARHSFLLRDDADVSRDTVALRTTPPAGSVDEEKRRPNVPDVSVDDPVVPVPDVFVDDPVVPPPAPPRRSLLSPRWPTERASRPASLSV